MGEEVGEMTKVPVTSENHWRIGKEIPITFILVIIGQAIASAVIILWSLSNAQISIESKLESHSYQLASLAADRYTQHDAKRDMQIMEAKIETVRQYASSIKEDLKWQKRK